jgi:hypothetical protein
MWIVACVVSAALLCAVIVYAHVHKDEEFK